MTQPPFITVHTVEVHEVIMREVIVIQCPFGCTFLFMRETVIGRVFIITAKVVVNPLYLIEQAAELMKSVTTQMLPRLGRSLFGSQGQLASNAKL